MNSAWSPQCVVRGDATRKGASQFPPPSQESPPPRNSPSPLSTRWSSPPQPPSTHCKFPTCTESPLHTAAARRASSQCTQSLHQSPSAPAETPPLTQSAKFPSTTSVHRSPVSAPLRSPALPTPRPAALAEIPRGTPAKNFVHDSSGFPSALATNSQLHLFPSSRRPHRPTPCPSRLVPPRTARTQRSAATQSSASTAPAPSEIARTSSPAPLRSAPES